jgi:SAM-dependent methyltransferase
LTVPPGGAGETFDQIAEAFDATRASPWPFVKDWLAGLGPLGIPLVDVGCGNGRHLVLAATLGKWGIGVDLSPRLLELARQRVPPGTGLVVGDARGLPLPDGVAGAVMAVAMLHHVPDEEGRRTVARELQRITRPGAPVLASVWALDDPDVARRAGARLDDTGDPQDLLVPWRAVEGSHVDRYYRVVTLAQLTDLMAEAGLAVVRAWDVGANHVVHARRP